MVVSWIGRGPLSPTRRQRRQSEQRRLGRLSLSQKTEQSGSHVKVQKKRLLKEAPAALQSDPNYTTVRLALKDVWRSKRSC